MSAETFVNVRLDFGLASEWCRGLVPGIARYARSKGNWHLYTAARAWEGLPIQPHGVISALRTSQEVEAVQGLPTVCVSGYAPQEGMPLVTHDSQAIGRMAADHLLSLGLEQFVCFTFREAKHFRERTQAFCERIEAAGFPLPEVLEPPVSEWIGRLRQMSLPCGAFAVNDPLAVYVERAASEAGISIPNQLALVSTDNDIVQCELCDVPLSSVALRTGEVGWHAAAVLDRLLTHGEVPMQPILVLPSHVEVRRSSDYLRVEDDKVRMALQILRVEYRTRLSSDDLARRVGVSRRHLERRFAAATGTSLLRERHRLQMQEACRLLGDSNMQIGEVALAVGMPDLNRFSARFRDLVGSTPRAYRKHYRTNRVLPI